jgi:Tfp pilus assembly protein PilF
MGLARAFAWAACLAFVGACAPAVHKSAKKPVRPPLTAKARAANDKLYYQGVEQYLKGDLKGASRTWNKVLEADPGHKDAKRSLARTAQELSALKKRKK